jgi:hypothetical protein
LLDDPHDLEYLNLVAGHSERNLEDGLVERVQEFMQQFGRGNLAFMGRQWHMEVDGDDFYIDLLFYHVRLHRYLVVELKNGKLRVGDIAQTKFYATTVDQQMRSGPDEPTIGLLICRGKNDTVARYALDGYKDGPDAGPLAIKSYEAADGELPTTQQIEAALRANG